MGLKFLETALIVEYLEGSACMGSLAQSSTVIVGGVVVESGVWKFSFGAV
jgi:hypothetical protein